MKPLEIGCTFRGQHQLEKSSLNRVLVPDNVVRIGFDAGLPRAGEPG